MATKGSLGTTTVQSVDPDVRFAVRRLNLEKPLLHA
jgi:hypothetical protein